MTVKIKPVVGGSLSVVEWADRVLVDGGTPAMRNVNTPYDKDSTQKSGASYAPYGSPSKNPSGKFNTRKGKNENV